MAILAPPYRPFSPGFPPLDPARGDGGATIAVTMRYAPLAFVLGLFTPVLQIDGKNVPASWGRVTTPVAFGEHHVHVHVPYLLAARIGTAETTVMALPGRTAELEYRAPLLAFLRGALGPPPQRYPGMALAVVLLIGAMVLGFCTCLGIFTSGGPPETPATPVATPSASTNVSPSTHGSFSMGDPYTPRGVYGSSRQDSR
ncbi:hypothetical protein Acy02nite_62760 [Actinoplanes cyaneus]|uniref:Uncharacterized protein n=1 Tax=Actinoplanes cyaneus TaxID=52696 RepID=A0A919IUR4_9ACTN|nr:hypothetical protein [Actinoplanes cyaneus]MCW2141525.1 hypothetical protein [Actinoplanes cyaneus]GID68395.1 hypothetical protein Acy02nite_62760 [Actinoplanes cyaneus]